MRSRLLPSLALWLLVCATVVPQAQQLRKIGEMELALVGLSATVDGARPAIPKNVASGVRILISGGGATLSPATAARLLGPFDIEAELSGPSFGETVTVRHSVTPGSSEANVILPLPAMAVSGEHTLANLRIVNPAQHPILDLQPGMVPVDVVEQVLITSVRTRPLTLQEIRDQGIVLDSDDYLGFEFTLGVLLESKPVKLSFPVVFDRQGIAVPVPESLPSLDVDSLQEPLPVPKMIPMMLKASSKLGPGSAIDFPEEDIRIPSLLVIPGEVGYLKQFFSAQLFVGNGTPATANLTVRDLTGTLQLPDNPDPNSPDPLSLAETVNGIQPTTMTIAAVGPDGKSGTADDITALRAGEQGMAEFLVRGDLEGFHNLIFDIKGTLDGLATGPLEVTGHAKGGVLVRNPFFDISFTLPTVVRAQEPFKLYATVTNKGQGIANDVTMSLDGASLSGLEPIGDTSKSITTLKPGQAETLVFDFKSLRTGQAVATYLRFNGDGAAGSIRFKVGVGERGVPLSPDTLVLPASVDQLPPDVIAAAMRVLGQAWSIANTPPNAMPPGVIRISKALVTSKALALAEAGLRVRLGQEATTAVRDLLPDFYGPVPVDRGFDQLLRTTDAGRNFTRAIGAFIATTAVSASALEEEFARIAASGRDFVSFSIASGNQGADVAVRLTDAGGRALVYTGSDDDPRPAIASVAIAPLGPPQDSPLFGLIAAPAAMPYTLELTGRNGDAIDLSLTYPRGDGSFTRLAASGVAIAANARARLVIDPARASPSIEIDTDGNGSVDTTTPLFAAPITATGPRFLSASVVGPETLSSAGPYGFNLAILFDRVVDEAAATDRARYAIPDNQFHSVRRQLSGRLVFGTLALPEGPYVPSAVTVSGMPDLRGVMSGNESQPLQSLLEDGGAVVSGRVINGEGQVASGVRVVYWANPSWLDCDTSIPPKPFAAAITDAQGRYRFNYVYRDRCGMAWRMNALDETRNSERSVYGLVRTAGERVTADIALLGRGSVSGIVRNAAGAPVAGAQVIVVSTLESQVGGGAITDGDGRYTVIGVTVGPVSIKAAKGRDVGAAAGRIARAGTTAFADVTLSGGSVTISGVVRTSENGVLTLATGATVVYEAANPLASGSIITGVATVGSDGRYEFSGMPKGNFAIRARLATGDFVHLPGIAVADQVITNFDVVIEVKRSGRVSGVVRFPDGSPAPGSVVTLSSRGVRGEQDGSFSIEGVEVAARSQSVRATSSDGLREGQAEVLVSEFGQHVSNVIVTLNGIGTLDLLVIDSAGNPVRNQIVQIARTGHNISPTDCTAFYLAPTDDQGRVQFAGLEVGAVRAVAIRATGTGVDIAKLDSAIPYEGSSVSGVLRFGGGGILTGTIRDDQGAPVFGANIEVHSKVYQPGICGFMPGVSHRVRTDLNGRYRVTGVPVGHVNVTASQEFFPTPIGASRVLARDGDELIVDLNLVHTISEKLTGYVFLPDGVTPAGAGVAVTASGGLPDVVVTTNDAGFFAFPRILPASAYSLTAADPHTGFVAEERVVLKIAQTPDAIVRHDVRLKGRGTVRIQVVDGGGVPVSNAHVTLKESQFPRETFEGVVEPSNQGVVTFTHVHEGSFSVSASDVFGRGGRISGDLPNDGATANVTVQLTVTGNVTGRFLMPDGVTPIPLGTIQLLANNRVIGQSTTESGENSGAFAFSYVPAGTVRLEGLDPATGRMGVAVGQLVTNNQDLTLDVKVQGLGTVTGVVTSNGVTQGGAHVTVSSGSFKATTTADGAGRYSVPGVPEGAVTVKADLDGALPSSATGTLIGEDATITVDVALQPSGAVTGTVRRSDGSIAPASIVTINVGGTRYSVTTDQDGDYQFDLIPAGTRVVSVDVIGSIDTATVTAMIHGGQINDVPIQLTGVGAISGLARDANGNPVGGTVSVTGHGWWTTVTVNPDGTFNLSPVLAGPFSAQVRYSSGSATLYGTATGVVIPGETASIAVTLQSTGEIRGVVLRADGATPAVGATLTLTGGGNSIVRQAFSAGEFSFAGLPLGTYALKIYDATTDGHARALGLVLAQNGDVTNTGVLVLDHTTLIVQAITPLDGAIGVSRTQPIVVTYSDPVTSVNGVNVKDAAGNLGAGRELSPDGRTLTLTGTWTDGAQITVEVTTSVADIFGRHISTMVTSRFTTVDTTAPTATLAPANGAYQISVTAPIVATFTEPVVNASLDGVITLSRAGVAVSGVTVRGPSNVLTFTPAAPLSDNSSYTATVVGAVDASGNQQLTPKVTTFLTTDTIAPVIIITSPTQSGWLNDATPGIVFQRGDGMGSGIDTASGSLSIDGVAVTPSSKSSTQIIYHVPASAPLSDGTHTTEATTADNAGNVASAQGVARIDTTAPSAAMITEISDGTTIAGTTSITASATDATSGVATIEVFRGATKVLDLLPPSFTGTWNASSTADGHHAMTARAIDQAGNVGPASAPLSVMVDNYPLGMVFVTPAANTRVRDTVSVTLSTNEPVDHIDVTVGTTTVSWTSTNTSFSGVLSLATAPEGTTAITAIAYGLQGDDPVMKTLNVIVDRLPPPAPDATRINAEPPTGSASLVFGSAGAVEGGAVVRLSNSANGATAIATAAANGSFTASILAAVDDLLSITATDAMTNQSAATLVAVRRVPSLPEATGNTSLQYQGLIADRVGAASGAVTADGAADAVFTINLSIGPGVTRTLSYVDLAGGGLTRSTRIGAGGALGVAVDAGAPLLNNPNGTVAFPITTGATLTLIASDGGFIVPNGTYVATAAFTDGTRFIAAVTIVAPEDRTAVAHSARIDASPATLRVTSASNPGTSVLTLTDIRDLDGSRVPDGANIAIAAADMATKDPGGAFIRSAGGAILDGTPAPNNPSFKVFTIVNGSVTATYSSQPVMPASLRGALAVIQLIAADANGNILGNEAISTFDLPLRAATDPGTVVSSPSSYFVDKGDRRSRLTISVPLPDGSKVAVTASGSSSIVNDQYVTSAGGTILGGATSSSGAQWRVFTVVGGAVACDYSPGTMLVGNRQTKTVNVQVVPANASGVITSSTPLAIGTITLTGAAASEVKFARESLPVLTVPQTTQVVVHHVHDTRANLLPDGVNVLMTVQGTTLITPNGCCYYASAGGLITDGQVPSDSRFRYFPLTQGEVIATYSPSTIDTRPGEVKTATVSVTVADPSGVMIDQTAIGNDTIQLLGPAYGTPGSVTPSTLLADGGAHVATASFGPILDTYGNTVPDGTRVVASVSPTTGITPDGCCYYSTVGGVLLDGGVSPSGNSYRTYTVENGAITVTYANQNITALPGQKKTVTVMVMEANADGSVASQSALGAVPLTLTGTTSAAMTASVTTMHADGADRRSTITVSSVRDSMGQLVPDGTKIGITAGATTTVTPDGCCYIVSAGGTIIGGTVAPDARFRIFTLQNGQAVFEYSAQGVIISSGQSTARVQFVSMSQSGVVLSSTALATVPIQLLALSGATVTAAPADLFADNAAHLSQITISNLTDAGGAQVPDGAKVALTVKPNVAVDPATSQYVQTVGGVLQSAGTTAGDGTPATNNANYQIYTVADGRVLASYSDVNINAGVGQTKVARVSVFGATASGAVQSNLIATGAINLHGTTSTIASGPATAARNGGTVEVTFSGIKDSGGTVVPDGTLVAVTAASNLLTYDTGGNVTSTGGSIVNGTTSPSGGNYKVFPVQNGTITVTYSPASAGVGTARIAIAPALISGATNGGKALVGGVWAITIQ